MTGADYADVLRGLMRGVAVPADLNRHPRLKILTPQQAALQKFDVALVAGMNDEVWPPHPAQNPWLSPEMVVAAGLPPADASIGKSAHHFALALSSPRVILSRAMRNGSAPAAASPFLTRLVMVLRGAGIEKDLTSKEQLVEINAALHAPDAVTPITPPQPRPDPALRPKELPVTAVENLMRDPYSVYARYVLKLRPKAPIDAAPAANEKGMFTHAALDAFVRKYPDKLPPNAEEELLKMGADAFKSRMSSPVVQAFWWPRFERIAKWFVKFENNRRELSHTLGTEVRGKLTFDLGGGESFTLTAIADRIDADDDGKISIIDYKTGAVPTQKDVESGLSPQLTLEALIAIDGGFNGVDKDVAVEALQYWKLSGGRPAAEITDVKADPESLVAAAKEGVAQLMKAFNDQSTPYLPAPRADAVPRYMPYAHLARTGEWSMVSKTEKRKPADPVPPPPKKKSARKSAKKAQGPKKS
ncbi:MAG: PD-(D/E)XK nuclease family protein [Bdellovibrionales bacterium]